ncbi:MAG: shikimate dehydrogenase [Gammaproteobacteria bacterium]
MSSIFDFDSPPDQYAVMGNPIAHSKSPAIHSAFARQTKQKMVYDAIQVDAGGFKQAVGNFRANGGKGLNITLPFKHEAFQIVDQMTDRAKKAGAVNTIIFKPEGTLFGDNTDGAGFLRDIKINHSGYLKNRRILLLGAGGATRGIISPICQENPAEIIIANRTIDKAISLANEFASSTPINAVGFNELEGMHFDLIVNGTSASLQGETLPLPESILDKDCWCYDLMYAKENTVFLDWASRHGAEILVDGLGMLVEQAAESFYQWRGVRPETVNVIKDIRAAL